MGVLDTFPKLSQFGQAHLWSSVIMAVIVISMQAAIAGLFVAQIDLGANQQRTPEGKTLLYPDYCDTTGSVLSENNARSIMVYLIIFILAQVFQFYIVLDALWQQNTIQIIMHVVFIVACGAYSVIQYFQIRDLLNPCLLNIAFRDSSTLDFSVSACNAACQLFSMLVPFIGVCIAVLAFFFLVYCFLAFKLYLEFGWKIYKKIGAAPEMRAMYRGFHVYIMLLKLDFFFFEAFAIQFLYLVLRPTDPEFGLTIAAIILALPIVYLAYLIVCKENMWGMIAWFCLLMSISAYYLFKIIRIYTPSQAAKYIGSGRFLTLFAALGLLVTLLSAFTSVYVWKNFGNGLKPYLNSDEPASQRNSVALEEPNRKRIEM